MDCASCALRIEGALERLPGVSGIFVAPLAGRLRMVLDESRTSPGEVEEIIRRLGYLPGPVADGGARGDAPANGHQHGHGHGHAGEGAAHWHQDSAGRLALFTGALLALAALAGLFLPPAAAHRAFAVACLIGLAPIARRAFLSATTGQVFTIESLLTLAALGALVIGATGEAAVVVFLFAVGEALEGIASGRARAGIRALSRLVPEVALVVEGSTTRETAAAELRPGQIVLVRPGDRIPADGIIAEGQAQVDESSLTGESVPVTRGPGTEVMAGTIATDAALHIRVNRAAADNAIARIIRLVEEAEEARAPISRFIDRFSRFYMPVIVAMAALVILVPPLAFAQEWDTWIYRGLALLLIGCPCALVISVPASMASALSCGARHGLLMKGGAVVEAAAGIRHVAFDKTGTLTRGRPEVTDIVALEADDGEVLALAAAVEGASSHPLAAAIRTRAEADGIALPEAHEARALPGRGVEAVVNGRHVRVLAASDGNVRAAVPDPAAVETLEGEGKTVVAVLADGVVLGLIAMRDEPRPDAAQAIARLKELGIESSMLTGDNPRTAAAIAGPLGLDFQAGMMPADKLATIARMEEEGGVMMVGDGINDAPALKQARVGVAMGSGTDVALETADAAILRDRVADVAAIIRLARAAMANVHQNIALALGLKALFLITSVAGITGLWIAVMADTGATVLVTLNALRLLTFNPARRG